MNKSIASYYVRFTFFISCVLFIAEFASAQKIESNSLMKPSGPFKVGHIVMELIDNNRREPATSDPSDLRNVPIQIWYPTRDEVSGKHAAYRPHI